MDVPSPASPRRVLTVGDGDLSGSVALGRAYGPDQIELLVTTILSPSELLGTYPDTAPANVRELGNDRIRYNIDATLLHQQVSRDDGFFDAILFHHPHLGVYWENEREHAQQHMSLISHYLDSARRLLAEGGYVHLCLSGNQGSVWRLPEICQRLRMRVTESFPAERPIFPHLLAREAQPDWKAPRRFRNGKLGSKHWLSNYGYRHQLTFPQNGHSSRFMNVSDSVHYFIRPMPSPVALVQEESEERICTTCRVCLRNFATTLQLEAHHQSPARPPMAKTEEAHDTDVSSLKECASQAKRPVESATIPTWNTAQLSISGRSTLPRQMVVSDEHHGKRLRWFLQHVARAGSKRQCEQMVQCGQVLLQGSVVQDSSRILAGQQVINIRECLADHVQEGTPTRSLDRIAVWPDGFVVLWKPVGVRVAGMFDANSLERQYSLLTRERYSPASKLDRGCSGLVVLQKHSSIGLRTLDIYATFTILVHGKVPDAWREGISFSLSTESVRRWKRVGADASKGSEASDRPARIDLLETIDNPALSTISVTTTSTFSGVTSAICYYLRKSLGCPVVGDRFAAKEYETLPRPLRQRIKQRICMGCTEVGSAGMPGFYAKSAANHKWSSGYWQTFLQEHDKKEVS